MISKLLLILLCLFNGKNDTIMSEKIDMIEFNTVVDPSEFKDPETKKSLLQFKPRYTQLILWKWDEEYARYNVIHWVILNGEYGEKYDYDIRTVGDIKIVTVIRMNILEKPYYKTIAFKTKNLTYTTTTSAYDPEILNKKLLEEQYREKPISITIGKINDYKE